MEFGRIIGKTSTNEFEFEVSEGANKFEYIQVKHPKGYNVLCQIIEIEKDSNSTIAKCNVLGYRDSNNVLCGLRTPLEPGAIVEYASDDFVQRMLGLNENTKGAYIGVLDGREKIKVFLDINKLITKHMSVLAKSGSGKTYCVSVLLEEILEKNIPIVVIDPHGEYSSLKYPNNKLQGFEKFGIKGKGYLRNIQEFSPDIEKNPEARPFKLSSKNLTGTELMHMLPAKLSSSQMGLLYSALKDVSNTTDFDQLLMSLQLEENNAKWTLINIVDYLKKLNIFSENPTTVSELVQAAKCSILNLRGVPAELQEIIVYKIVSDLFVARKNSEIPPFLLVIEEAHNYSPERSFGEAKSSAILRQVVAEGRKFGMGCAVISQRPARVDKCLLSNTPIFLAKAGIIPIEKLFLDYTNTNYPRVLGLDEKDLKIKSTSIKHIVQNRFNGEIFTLKTSRGHEITITGEHKFINLNKDFKFFERSTNKLKTGDVIIIPSKINLIKNNTEIKYSKSFISEVERRKKIVKNRIFAYYDLKKDKKLIEISKQYNIPILTLKNWKWGLQKPFSLEFKGLLNKNYLFSNYKVSEHKPLLLLKEYSIDLAVFLSLLIAEGHEPSSTKSYVFSFTNSDDILLQRFKDVSKRLFGLNLRVDRRNNITTLTGASNLLELFLNEIGYETRNKSSKKKIPNFILNLPDVHISTFLTNMFDTEGCVTNKGVFFSSTSRDIINGVSFLLLRLGIRHSIYHKKMKYNSKPYYHWQICILKPNTYIFANQVGFSVRDKINKLNLILNEFHEIENVNDMSPFSKSEFFDLVKQSNVSSSFRDKISRISHTRPILREHLVDFNNYLPSSMLKNNFLKFFNSDIILDKITSIKSEKYSGYVYDIETGLSNLVAGLGGIVTHNSMISQCSTQFILKLTNPNDLRAITSSVEGITTSTENEIQNLRIGTAMVVGVVDTPLFVNIRPRRTKHGGEAVDIVESFSNITTESKGDLSGFIQDNKSGKQVLNIIRPKVSKNDIEQLSTKKIKKLQTIIVPCLAVSCKDKGVQFNLLCNLVNGQVVTDIERGTGKAIAKLDKISEKENNLLKRALGFKGEFTAAQLFSNSGLQFSEVYEVVNTLVKKDYFIKSGNNFQLSEAIKFYLNLKNLASFEKPDFIGLEYDSKLDVKVNSEEVLVNLKRFVEVTGSKEVFIVKYDVEYC